jgi:hypothetical protein
MLFLSDCFIQFLIFFCLFFSATMMLRSSPLSLLFLACSTPLTLAHQSVRGSVLLENLEDPQLLTEFQSWASHHDKVYDDEDEALERLMIWKINNGECY